MENLHFTQYLASFLDKEESGCLPFFKGKSELKTYNDLVRDSLALAQTLKNLDDSFLALKIESSYLLFTHLLASFLAKKEVLILSSKEPALAVENYQAKIPFTKIISDRTLENSSGSSSFLSEIIDNDTIAFNLLSSGSSGPPKKIPISFTNIQVSAKNIIEIFQMNFKDTSFMNLPHHHIGGLMILWRAFLSQGSVTNDELDDFQFISLVPLQLKRFLQDPQKKAALQKCRAVLIGGAPLDENLRQEAKRSHIAVFETYGMSETTSLVMLDGRALEAQELKLDSSGKLLIKGATLSPALILDRDGFYHTQDVFKENGDGSFSFLHRDDILFKSAGVLINPAHIENKVHEIPWIAEAICVPIRHPQWTWAQALVYKSSGLDKNDSNIKDYLNTVLHPHQIPRFYYEAPESFFNKGVKPKRFEIAQWAQEKYYKSLFHYLYIPSALAETLIIFFHGFMEDHTDMIPLMNQDQNSDWLFIDFPGHGQSLSTSFNNRSEIFDELRSLIAFKAQNKKIIFYGYSMGGRVAIELALILPPALLILESAHFGLSSEIEKKLRLQSDRQLLASKPLDIRLFFKDWYKNPIFGNYDKSPLFELDLQKKLLHDPCEWQASLEFISPGVSPYVQDEIIKKLKYQKIIGISGDEDVKYSSHYAKMAGLLPHFTFINIKNSGHNPHKTHLSEIKAILKRFF